MAPEKHVRSPRQVRSPILGGSGPDQGQPILLQQSLSDQLRMVNGCVTGKHEAVFQFFQGGIANNDNSALRRDRFR